MNQNMKTELSERIAWAKRTTDWFEEAGGKTRLPGIMAAAKHMPIHDLKYTTPVLVLASITQLFLNREHQTTLHLLLCCFSALTLGCDIKYRQSPALYENRHHSRTPTPSTSKCINELFMSFRLEFVSVASCLRLFLD